MSTEKKPLTSLYTPAWDDPEHEHDGMTHDDLIRLALLIIVASSKEQSYVFNHADIKRVIDDGFQGIGISVRDGEYSVVAVKSTEHSAVMRSFGLNEEGEKVVN